MFTSRVLLGRPGMTAYSKLQQEEFASQELGTAPSAPALRRHGVFDESPKSFRAAILLLPRWRARRSRTVTPPFPSRRRVADIRSARLSSVLSIERFNAKIYDCRACHFEPAVHFPYFEKEYCEDRSVE